MSRYAIKYEKRAQKDLIYWRKNSKFIYSRIERIIEELREHPREGIGKPEYMHGDEKCWSRRITSKDRIKYDILDKEVIVNVISARGHYDDH